MLHRFVVPLLFQILISLPLLAAQPSGELRLGAVLALSGDQAPQNTAFLEGIQLALGQFESEKEAGAPRIVLAVEDSQLLSPKANTAVRKLLSVDRVHGVILGSVVEAMAAGAALEKAHIPGIVLFDSSKEIEDLGDYTFSIGLWSEASGWVAAKYALTSGRKAAIIGGLEPWGETLARGFKDKFRAGGGEIVGEWMLDIGTTDFRTAIARAKASQAEVLYVPFCYNLIPLYKQFNEARLEKIKLLTSDCIADAHLHEAPGVFEGVIETAAPNLNSAPYQEMLSYWKAWKGGDPLYPFYVALGYDAARLFIKGWKEAGVDGPGIARWLRNMPPFPGAAGKVQFDAKGSSRKEPGVFEVTGQKILPLGTFQ